MIDSILFFIVYVSGIVMGLSIAKINNNKGDKK